MEFFEVELPKPVESSLCKGLGPPYRDDLFIGLTNTDQLVESLVDRYHFGTSNLELPT